MYRILSFILFFLMNLTFCQAAEREYVISNISRLLDSYSKVDFTKSTDEAIDPKKFDCAIKVNEFNRQQSKTLRDLFDQFTQKKIDEDKLLRSVLDIRFRNLNFFLRHKGFNLDKQVCTLPNIHLGPGSSIMCQELSVDGGLDLIGADYVKYIVGAENGGVLLRFLPIKEQESYENFGDVLINYNKITDPSVRGIFAPLINDNLYVLTQIILGIFSLRPPHYFSYETYDYLSASQSLWPLLEKVTQGADPFLLDDDISLFDNRALVKEYEIYAVCLLQISNYKMPLLGLGCIPNRDYIITLGSLNDTGAVLGDWSLPALPATLDKMRIPQAPTTISTSVSDVSVETKPTKSSKQTSRKGAQRKKRIAQPADINSRQNGMNIHLPSTVDTASSTEPASKTIDLGISLPASSVQASPAQSATDPETKKQEDEFYEEIMNDHTFDFTTYKIPSKDKGKGNRKQRAETTTTTTVTETSAPQGHLFASWNRKLHANRNLTDIPLRTEPVAPSQLKVLEDIFDATTSITYGVFESLWKHLNGTNSIKTAHKKSHRRLLNSQGKVVGGTFALHGPRTQYSDDNKRELQNALTLIGCGRSYLSSLENK